MCGRYVLKRIAEAEAYWLERGAREWRVSYNIAPTQPVPVLRASDEGAVVAVMRWGLIPYFAKGVPPRYPTFNARIETIETAASYRGPWNRSQRCIQIASGFYEWHTDEARRKAPYFIRLADQRTFGFAALWDRSIAADGSAIESCTHITMPGNALLQSIHNSGSNPYRMPAILRAEDFGLWLTGTVEQARGALLQYPADLMDAYEVSAPVNSAKNDDELLIEPVHAA